MGGDDLPRIETDIGQETFIALDQLSGGKGIAALCRIARYDRSSLVSRKAALVIIRPEEKSSEQTHIDSEVVERELGASTRASAQWLRQYLAQLRD